MSHAFVDDDLRPLESGGTDRVPTLHVADGPDVGTVHRLDQPSLTVGRRSSNAIVLDHPAVSRVHARLSMQGGVVLLTDLSSTAGTTVDGHAIANPTTLDHGDRIGFGPVELVFEDPSAMGVIEEVTQVDLAPGEVPAPTLSPRQREIVRLMADGHSNSEIADELGLTHRTVKSYASEIYARLGTPNRAGAVAMAIRHELL